MTTIAARPATVTVTVPDGKPEPAAADATPAMVALAAAAYRDWFADRELEDVTTGGWTDAQRGLDYVAVIRALMFVHVGDRHVAVVAPDTADGHLWGHVGADCLDYAGQALPGNVEIRTLDARASVLTWVPESPSEDLLPSDFDATV